MSSEDLDRDFALVPRPLQELSTARTTEMRIVREMVTSSLTLARETDQLSKQRFRIGTTELCRPDYEQVLLWAEKLALTPDETLARLFDESYCNSEEAKLENEWTSEEGKRDYTWRARTEVVHGRFRKLHWNFARLLLKRFECEHELQLTHLSFTPVMKFRRWRLKQARERVASLEKQNPPSKVLIQYETDRLNEAKAEREQFEALSCILNASKLPFPNLKYLGCTGLALRELNLKRFPLLEELYCDFNLLETIDLSGVPRLRVLDCNENDLTRLDLSPVPSLQAIDCSWNQIGELDLFGPQNLRKLRCNENFLTKIDLSPASSLRSLQIGQNRLTSLNASPAMRLQEIYVVENQLTELDVSGLRELEFINCHNNQIRRLVLKGRDQAGRASLRRQCTP